MAKKKRRVRRQATPKSAAPQAPTLSKEEQFQEEYSYVLKDLRRVFVIAGAMFVLLIAVNLILS